MRFHRHKQMLSTPVSVTLSVLGLSSRAICDSGKLLLSYSIGCLFTCASICFKYSEWHFLPKHMHFKRSAVTPCRAPFVFHIQHPKRVRYIVVFVPHVDWPIIPDCVPWGKHFLRVVSEWPNYALAFNVTMGSPRPLKVFWSLRSHT